MPQGPQCFKVKIAFENDAHETCIIAVSKNATIRTATDAVNHIMALDATTELEDGTKKKVTRIHHKDTAGDFFNVVSAVPVSEEPFPINEAPRLRSLADVPQPAAAP